MHQPTVNAMRSKEEEEEQPQADTELNIGGKTTRTTNAAMTAFLPTPRLVAARR